ncbi:MAG: tRNA dihydrouridine(20/20a) synthase DusA [Myxococcota bacterium]
MSVRGQTVPVSVAPMMDVTDRHTRWLYRRLSRHTLLYTEMVTAHALHHGDVQRLLSFDDMEHPVALQLGGDDAAMLSRSAQLGVDFGYDEINLNIGCPSPRVQKGNFGACLMTSPQVVADAVSAMRAAVSVPITVKCRIGVDDRDSYEDLLNFAKIVCEAGADRLSVHARKAWLNGLSPKQNRNVPPLRYDDVYRLTQEDLGVAIEINGGVLTLDDVQTHLEQVDAVMIGRGVWHNPWMLADVDRRFFGSEAPMVDRRAVADALIVYAETQIALGHKAQHVLRHAGPLFHGLPGAKGWKQAIANVGKGGTRLLVGALERIDAAAVRQAAWEQRAAL